ncbi:hypothetical protein [Parvularcula oceani]|uniref:hypothetical protein n=1 Tax=Parvularcula oceani TaxID=1247963 RepID=UPI00055D2B90|nr:hypothetical protein [Parvularcula oceani]
MISSLLRSGLLASSAIALLSACSGGGDVASTGGTAPVVINPGGGGGGSSNGFDFVGSGGCPSGLDETTVTSNGQDIRACRIPAGVITTDLTLTSDNAYALDGTVFVGENAITVDGAQSATLTIEPGTVIFGSSGRDALVVSPGSRIEANGTQADPIIMTSASDLADGDSGDSAREAASDGTAGGSATARGEWGGLVINGLAPINDCADTGATPGTEDCTKDGEGGSGLFGGGDAADDSGSLRYLRVQYAGFAFSSDNELNGIAFQGVGSGTEVEYVQVHNNADDGVEFFGGTVSPRYVAITGAGDDSIDWTDGWQGNLQYAVVVQTEGDADRGIEGDNRGDDVDLTPRSNPLIANFTFLGAEGVGDDGVKLRAGTNAALYNGVVVNFEGDGLDYDDEGTGPDPQVFSLFVAENGAPYDSDGEVIFEASDSNVASTGATLNGLFLGDTETDVAATTDIPGDDTEDTDYLGAFAPGVQSVAASWLADWTLEAPFPDSAAQGCPSGTEQSSRAVPSGRSEDNVCTLPAVITADLRLTRGNLYELDGTIFVGNDLGPDPENPRASAQSATLTIEPGVTLFGSSGRDALVVTRGSQIEANGTAAAPVVMTSLSDVDGSVDPSARGEWGGLVINGRAPINDCGNATATPGTVACEKDGEGGSGLFGGASPEDDSGNLNYLQVRYAGFAFTSDNELNGIAFQGVGSETDVDFVQVHNNQDDGVEFFGGTVSARHLVITGAGDDSIDWTDGWQGNLQYAIVVQAEDDGDRAIEGDNRGDDVDLTPRSNPQLANLTLIGNGSSDIVKLRAGTNASIYNSILLVADAEGDASGTNDGIDFDQESLAGIVPTFYSTYVVDVENPVVDAEGDLFSAANGNVDGEALGQDSTLTADGTDAELVPGANELAVDATDIEEDGEFFDDSDYIGAVGGSSDDWYQGWTFSL